jgi:DNA-binding SARP family transcriptional activator/tetratricopeptide (TPR) repeat protein/TolB-like protein
MTANLPDRHDNNLIAVTRVELRLLGHFELVLGDSTITAIPSKKAKALLIVLAAAPRFTVTRARLASLLWGDSSEEQARQSLRQLLSNFRRASTLQSSLITISSEDAIGLDPKLVTIDRDSLVEVPVDASTTELLRVADLYRGEFAFGAEINEPAFDEWLQSERERIRELAIAVFDRLVRDLVRQGKHDEAYLRATALLAIDPMREETQRLVIAQEAIVSGRASAMKRYEGFRILLRDELGVRPEPATLQLLDKLRELSPSKLVGRGADNPPGSTATRMYVEPAAAVAAANEIRTAKKWTRGHSLIVVATVLILFLGGWAIKTQSLSSPVSSFYVGEDNGRVSVAVLPFESPQGKSDIEALATALESETTLAFARSNRLSVVALPDHQVSRSPVSLGKTLHVRYVVKTNISPIAGGEQANVTLFDSATGISIWSAPIVVNDESRVSFAREFYRYIFSEIALHRAQTFSDDDKDSTEGLLWRAEAAQVRSRVGTSESSAAELYERILVREPNHLFALLGLSSDLILKVARNQSDTREADIQHADELLKRAKVLAPNLADIAFKEGMLNKLRSNYEQASVDFERAFRLDPTHWTAAVQYAHVNIFLGRFEQAYDLMQVAMKTPLPDIAIAETGYMAGETALVAGHLPEAVAYLDMAVSGNPTVGRIHALHAAALQMAGRPVDAKAAAAEARRLSPGYTPKMMARRGGSSASARYVAARGDFVGAFRTALNGLPTN